MEWTRPLATLIAVGIAVWSVGAAYALLGGIVAGGDRPAMATVALVAIALGLTILVGRRSARWTDNPETYW